VRAAALEFTQALKAGDASRVREMTFAGNDAESQRLAAAVVGDTLTGRGIQMKLAGFADAQQKAAVVGSDLWIGEMEAAAETGPILKAGDRVRVGEEWRDGSMFLRQVGTGWKVEVISTLVAESGGAPTVADPAVEYRFNVTRAINAWMLERLNAGEFATFKDYQRSRNAFWMEYLSRVARGDDPKDLLATLPAMPKEEGIAVER